MAGVTDAVPSAAHPATTQAPGAELVLTVNVFRGLAITLVVALHASGGALPLLTGGQGTSDLLEVLNRALQFVVPAFLFISAAVLARSLAARPDLGRYLRRRALRGVWPYLLWTLAFALWYVWHGDRPPAELRDPQRWLFWLTYGKASFHLYFLLVLLELYAAVPLLLALTRRLSPTAALLLGFGAQALLFVANAAFWHLRFPASTLLWYVPVVLLGLAFGPRLADFPRWWRRHRLWWLALTALGAALYLPQALALVDGGPVTSWLYSLGHWVYSTGASVALLALSFGLARRRPRLATPLAELGALSMPVYLLHPVLLQLLGDLGYPGRLGAFLGVLALYSAAALALPWLVGRALQGTRVSTLLFGR